ncbi:MAG: DUF4105 domain-containing protein [Xanthomonadaceae bacterium]|nr:DUF4105 domain-containing protein [Xanthomonadaceae bacterium]
MLVNAGLLLFYSLIPHSAQSAEKPAYVQAWIQDSWRRLPIQVQRTLVSPVAFTIKFKKLGSREFGLPLCVVSESDPKPKGRLFYGHTTDLPLSAPIIKIHSGLLDEIQLGENDSTQYGCGHRTGYRLAVATLIHEWMHIYDSVMKLSINSRFRALTRFQKLHKWWSDLVFMGFYTPLSQKNKLGARSPDRYELKNPREALAVNFEYFLLDPEFACRRPALQGYFLEHFSDPFAGSRSCKPQTTVKLSSRNPNLDLKITSDLNPARIAEVHYLYADTGTAAMSKWGHAMFRLIICAPERKTVGPECRNDVAYHVVISYRANVSDIMINYIKGIIGKYPSKMFLIPFSEVITEYTKEEMRDLISLPIQFTELEKQAFIESTIESYWGYLGKYTFITNNCGTESLHLMKVADESVTGSGLHTLTPKKFYKTLIKSGWVDKASKTVFRSKKADFDSALGILGVTQEKYFVLGAIERRDHVRARIVADSARREKIAAAAFIIESSVEYSKNKEFEKHVLQQMEDTNSEVKKEVDRLSLELKERQPWKMIQPGYGIPLVGEWLEVIPDHTQSAGISSPELRKILEALFKSELEELRNIQANKTLFRKWILKQLE